MRLKEVNINSFIVIYLVVAQCEKLGFSFSGFLVAQGPVIHRLIGCRLVTYPAVAQARATSSHLAHRDSVARKACCSCKIIWSWAASRASACATRASSVTSLMELECCEMWSSWARLSLSQPVGRSGVGDSGGGDGCGRGFVFRGAAGLAGPCRGGSAGWCRLLMS